MSNLKRNGRLRWSPSFLRNRGTITRAQKRALREWWGDYGIPFAHDEVIDLDAHFEFEGPLLIEIGFGMGDHLTHLASSLPHHRVLGIEVHRPGLAAVTARARELGLKNLRLIRGDARLVLTDHLPRGLATAIFLQFPDPWPQAADEHRRFIQGEAIETLRKSLVPGGQCLITTDVSDYASHCRKVFAASPGWREVENPPLRAWRVPTLYERKALKEGRIITEIGYERSR